MGYTNPQTRLISNSTASSVKPTSQGSSGGQQSGTAAPKGRGARVTIIETIDRLELSGHYAYPWSSVVGLPLEVYEYECTNTESGLKVLECWVITCEQVVESKELGGDCAFLRSRRATKVAQARSLGVAWNADFPPGPGQSTKRPK
ncbi:hypothetical protein B0H11DRAFT_1928793 [Mycena galericulata]|nr:hypothetical protein B0H11DRAFT_1928793 [Mycena galericulata]